MDVVPFDLPNLTLSSSPSSSPPPPTPPTHPGSPASPAASERHMSMLMSLPPDTDRPGSPSEDTDVGSCSYKSDQSSPDDDSPHDSPTPSVSPSVSPAISLSEEGAKKKDNVQGPTYELRNSCGGSRVNGRSVPVKAKNRMEKKTTDEKTTKETKTPEHKQKKTDEPAKKRKAKTQRCTYNEGRSC